MVMTMTGKDRIAAIERCVSVELRGLTAELKRKDDQRDEFVRRLKCSLVFDDVQLHDEIDRIAREVFK